MKILRLDNRPSEPNQVILMADSAWRPDRRPLFLPEEGADSLSGALRLALRVDRLGKCIDRRFAARYIGAAAVVALIDGPGMTPYSDDSIVQGTWLDLHDFPAECTAALVTADGVETVSIGTVIDIEAAAAAIALLSDGATFKTGDVVIMPGILTNFSPAVVQAVSVAAAGSEPILEFKVK